MWNWLKDENNRGALTIVVTVFGVIIGGMWTAFVYFDGKTWLQSFGKNQATYYLCMGEHQANCGKTDWVPCGTDMTAYIKQKHPDACVYITATTLSDPR